MLAAVSEDKGQAEFLLCFVACTPSQNVGKKAHLLQFSCPTVVSARLVVDPASMLRTSAPLDEL